MTIQPSAAGRWRTGLLGVLAMLLLTTAARAQGTLEYRFTGQVRSLNPASNVFPGVSVGSPVEGWFTIDYTAVDSDPSPLGASYSSAQVALGGMIGESRFASVAHPGNLVRVKDGLEGGEPGLKEDWTVVYVVPGGRLEELSLTFYDSAGRAINGQALPGSAAALSAFPDVVLYAAGANVGFGQYRLNVAITQVPEPSVMVLGLVGLALLGTLRQGWRSAAGLGRSRAEPGAARNDGPATAS